MSALPTKRLLVYVAIGLVVLVVGAFGLASARGSSGGSDGVVIETGAGDGSTQTLGAVVSVGQTDEIDSATTTTEVSRIWVQVAGAVNVPGVYQLFCDSRVFEAVAAAGGFSDEADEQAVALAAGLFDGCRVYVPGLGETAPGGVVGPAESTAGLSGAVTSDAAREAADAMVSINSASIEQLDALPGIGPSLAQQIVSYREAQGPFTSIDQLTDVPGIGPSKLEQLRPLVVL